MTDSSRHVLRVSPEAGPRPPAGDAPCKVTLAIEVYVTGTGELADSWRESATWCNANAATAEAHEIIAMLAMQLARIHWRDADRIRGRARKR